jgi:hypothetical protein
MRPNFACMIAWQFWNAPSGEAPLLRRLQARRCGQCAVAEAARLLGFPKLQVINRDVRVTKCALEARDRRAPRHLKLN